MGESILGVVGEYKGDEEKNQMMLVHVDEKWFWQSSTDDTINKSFHWEFN